MMHVPDIIAQAKAHGFEVRECSPYHFQLKKDGRLINFWPKRGKFMEQNAPNGIHGFGLDYLFNEFNATSGIQHDIPTVVVERTPLGTVVEIGELETVEVPVQTGPYPSPTSCPHNSALFFQLARVLMHLQRGEIAPTTGMAGAELDRLKREFMAVTGDTQAQYEACLDLFDPEKREQELLMRSSADAPPRFTGGFR